MKQQSLCLLLLLSIPRHFITTIGNFHTSSRLLTLRWEIDLAHYWYFNACSLPVWSGSLYYFVLFLVLREKQFLTNHIILSWEHRVIFHLCLKVIILLVQLFVNRITSATRGKEEISSWLWSTIPRSCWTSLLLRYRTYSSSANSLRSL